MFRRLSLGVVAASLAISLAIAPSSQASPRDEREIGSRIVRLVHLIRGIFLPVTPLDDQIVVPKP
jgi:hypothetical protein